METLTGSAMAVGACGGVFAIVIGLFYVAHRRRQRARLAYLIRLKQDRPNATREQFVAWFVERGVCRQASGVLPARSVVGEGLGGFRSGPGASDDRAAELFDELDGRRLVGPGNVECPHAAVAELDRQSGTERAALELNAADAGPRPPRQNLIGQLHLDHPGFGLDDGHLAGRGGDEGDAAKIGHFALIRSGLRGYNAAGNATEGRRRHLAPEPSGVDEAASELRRAEHARSISCHAILLEHQSRFVVPPLGYRRASPISDWRHAGASMLAEALDRCREIYSAAVAVDTATRLPPTGSTSRTAGTRAPRRHPRCTTA